MRRARSNGVYSERKAMSIDDQQAERIRHILERIQGLVAHGFVDDPAMSAYSEPLKSGATQVR
jgi:hypothetical protein